MLHNLDTIYYIARSSKNFSTEINFSENIFLVYRGYLPNIPTITGIYVGNSLPRHDFVSKNKGRLNRMSPTVGNRHKYLSFGGCSQQTQILTLPAKLKSSQTFLAIKHCERTKIGQVINLAQS